MYSLGPTSSGATSGSLSTKQVSEVCLLRKGLTGRLFFSENTKGRALAPSPLICRQMVANRHYGTSGDPPTSTYPCVADGT